MSELRDVSFGAHYENLGGLGLEFYFMPIENIRIVPEVVDGIQDEITFSSGSRWYVFSSVFESTSFNSALKKTEHGEYTTHNISGSISKDTPELISSLEKLRNRKLIVLIKDNNGQWKLVGTKEQPIYFDYKQKTNKTANKKNLYSFSFKGNTYKAAPFYPTGYGPVKTLGLPSNLSAQLNPIDPAQVHLTFTSALEGEIFEVWRQEEGKSFLRIGTVNSDTGAFTDNNIKDETTYNYKLSMSGDTTVFSNIASVTSLKPLVTFFTNNLDEVSQVGGHSGVLLTSNSGKTRIYSYTEPNNITEINAPAASVTGEVDLSDPRLTTLNKVDLKNNNLSAVIFGEWVNQDNVVIDLTNSVYDKHTQLQPTLEYLDIVATSTTINKNIIIGIVTVEVDALEDEDLYNTILSLQAKNWTVSIVYDKLLSTTIGETKVISPSTDAPDSELWLLKRDGVSKPLFEYDYSVKNGDVLELWCSDIDALSDIDASYIHINEILFYEIFLNSSITLDLRGNNLISYDSFLVQIKDFCFDSNVINSQLTINIKDGRNFDLNEDEYDLTILREELKNDYGVDIQLYNIKWSVEFTAAIGSTQTYCKGAGIEAGSVDGNFVGVTDIYSFIYDTTQISQLTISLGWSSGRRIKPIFISRIDKFAFQKVTLGYLSLDYSNYPNYNSWSDLMSDIVLKSNWIEYNSSASDGLYNTSNPSNNNVIEILSLRTGGYRIDTMQYLDYYIALKRLTFQSGTNPSDYTFENRPLEYFFSSYSNGGHLTFQDLPNFEEFKASGSTQFSGKTIRGNMPLLHTINGDQYTGLNEVDTTNMPLLRYLNFRNIDNLTIATATYNDLIELRGWYNSAIDYSLFKSLTILDTRQGGYGQELDNATHNILLTQLNSSTLVNTELKLQAGPIYQTRNKPLDSVNYNLCRDLSENKNFNITSIIVEYNSVNTICYLEKGTRNIRRKSDDTILQI